MGLKNKSKEMWEEDLGGLILVLIGYIPLLVYYFVLDNLGEKSALYNTGWAFILTVFTWYMVFRFAGDESDNQ